MKLPSIKDSTGINFDQVRSEFEVPIEFGPEVEAELAEDNRANANRLDHTNLGFIAIDPEGSIDLDQAIYISSNETGFTLYYAIADVAEFVLPGSAIDTETRQRGVTLYSPDTRTGLHPSKISEDRCSLLSGTTKPVALWTIELDDKGEALDWKLERSLIKVSEAISYTEAQKRLDEGDSGVLELLEAVGKLRLIKEAERGGVSINLPSQEVIYKNNQYSLTFQQPRPIERYNAQISLLAGMVAGSTLNDIGTGILRTLPEANEKTIKELRTAAKSLGLSWDNKASYADFVRTLTPTTDSELAFLNQATAAFRGASYISLSHTETDLLTHSAIASLYAHVTAPLRRLVDRFNNEILLAHFAGDPIPDWVTDALEELPSIMNRSKQKSSGLDRAMTDLVEAIVMADRVGETFDATVVNERFYKDTPRAVVQIESPAIISELEGESLEPGDTIKLKLIKADLETRKLSFTIEAQSQS